MLTLIALVAGIWIGGSVVALIFIISAAKNRPQVRKYRDTDHAVLNALDPMYKPNILQY